MSENTKAFWEFGIYTGCPKCDERFDIVGESTECITFNNPPVMLCEHNTKRTMGIEVECPECGHEFKVDLEY